MSIASDLHGTQRTGERRVVVTGLGLISCCGTGADKTWGSLIEGRSGVGPITLFDASRMDTRFAGQVNDFRPEDFFEVRDIRRMDRFQQFALAAAQMAVDDSKLVVTPQNAERIATLVGSGIGGLASLENAHQRAIDKGAERLSALFILQLLPNLAPGYITMRFGFKGPSWSTNSACATSAHALGEAMHVIKRGDADIAVAGGSEAPITPLGVGGFNAMKALSTHNESPAQASRPFDADRDGFVLAEGAGILILEELEHALARGAKIRGEIVGYGASSDAHHATSPAPEHEGAQRCMRLALKQAGLAPSQVDYLNAHGTSTPIGDLLEIEGVQRVFGDDAKKVAISSTKSMHGHMNGAAGAAEAAICIMALEHGIIPPTINLEHQDPKITLDCVPNRARRAPLEVAMTNSFGFGGTNATLILRRYRA